MCFNRSLPLQGQREIAQQLRALNALAEDLGLASMGVCKYVVHRNLHKFTQIYEVNQQTKTKQNKTNLSQLAIICLIHQDD